MKRVLGFVAACVFVAGTASAQVTTNIAYAKRSTINPFYPDDTQTTYLVSGRITSPSFSTNRTEFYIQDTNDNTGIFVNGPFPFDTNTYALGYGVSVEGVVAQSNGLRAINPSFSFLLAVTDPTPLPPPPLAATVAGLLAAAETNEARLVEVTNVTITAGTWPSTWQGNSGTLTVTDQTGQITLFLDRDTEIDGQLAPTNAFTVRGIFSQFDSSTNANAGYQILPRSYADIIQDVGPTAPSITIVNSNAQYSIAVGQQLSIDLVGQDPNSSDTLVFSSASAPAGSSLTSLESRAVRFTWTPGIGDLGTTTNFTVDVTDGSLTGSVGISVYILNATEANIILNEFLYDPASGVDGDANNDGTPNFDQDEFLEIVNNNGIDVDITGWQVLQGTNLMFTFPACTFTAQTAVVVFGGGIPNGLFGYAQVFTGGVSWVGFNNSGSLGPVRLVTTGGVQIISYDYVALPDDVNQSYTRSPDISGSFAQHLSANPLKRFSPGTFASGTPFPGTGQTNTPPQIAPIADTFARIAQVRTIPVVAVDPEVNPITFTATGGPSSSVLVSNGYGTADFIYTGVVADAGLTFTVTVFATDGNLTNSELFLLSVPPTEYSGLLINEILPDPDASGGIYIDANNDGGTNNLQDEFVEIVNDSTNAINMAGFRITDGVATRHTFTSLLVPTGGHVVVFAGGSIAMFTNPPAVIANTGSLGLDNTGDTLSLFSPQTQLVDRLTYSNAPAAASITRFPDITGEFTNHFEATGLTRRASPGRRVDGTTFTANLPPFLAPIGNKVTVESNAVTFAVTATDIDNDAITLSVGNAPAGSTFGTTNGIGTFTWSSPTPAGVYTTTFFAADNDGTNSETILITVNTNSGGGGGPFTNTIFWFDFEDVAPGVTNFDQTADAVAPGLSISLINSSDGSFTTNLGNPINAMNDNGWQPAGNYYGFTVTVDVGSSLTMTGFRFDCQRSGTGPTNWAVRSSLDGYTSNLGFGVAATAFAAGGTNIVTLSLSGVTGSVGFRIYGLNASAGTGTFRIDNVIGLGSVSALVGTDDDGDGIPNDWELLYFGGATNATAGEDVDNDGFINLHEYIALTIPTNGLSYFRANAISNASGRTVSFLTATGRLYGVDSTTNLLPPTAWSTVQSGLSGTGSDIAVTDTNEGPARAYRVNVKMQ